MARQVFFSFHHARDNWRANQVRNSWVTQDRKSVGFWDAAEWEKVKKTDAASVHKWIDKQMEGTSVTAVLVGAETANRDHVRYEIRRVHELGKGILAVRISNIKNKNGLTDIAGENPFYKVTGLVSGTQKSLGAIYPIYDYVSGDGYKNLGDWIEKAAKAAGR